MPNRFSWEAFDDDTIKALVEASADTDKLDIDNYRDFLQSKYPRPDNHFVHCFKDTLLRTWLPQYAGLNSIVDELIEACVGPMGQPNSTKEYLEYIKKTRNTRTLQTVISTAMLRFGDQDVADDGSGKFFRRFSRLRPSEQPTDERVPHEYQEEAWQRLGAEFAKSQTTGCFEGLLIMPTGSGKTYTAVSWLMKNVVNQGMRILWLAHTHELLTQAAAEFQALCGIVMPKNRLVRIRAVSSLHCAATQIDPADDVIVASIGSLARRHDIVNKLISDSNRFVVIDEAHRAPAKSYKDFIDKLKQRKPYHILGLTATPTRTLEIERPVLKGLFGGNTISQITIRTLIENKVLARPHLVTVKTDEDVEKGLTQDDLKHYARFGDLSEKWLNRIAEMSTRNDVIVRHYLDYRKRYGPTLIFAINVFHAALLTERLKKEGVRAEYIASYKPDNAKGGTQEVIQQFRDGDLDVLVNVQIMTEGVDVPSIQTVMLTRPTSSEILLRQMIGRGLRGKKMGGTDIAYLVSFEDHWGRFRDWQSPFDLVPDIVKEATQEGRRKLPPETEIISDDIPWSIIREVADVMAGNLTYGALDVFEAIPHGWYILSCEQNDQARTKIVPVYDHQRVCWEALMNHLRQLDSETLKASIAGPDYDDFFSDCDYPWPSKSDVSIIVNQFAEQGAFPEYRDFEERRKCDPCEVAREIRQENFIPSDLKKFIEERYTDIARAIYPDLRSYRHAIDDAVYEIDYPEESNRFKRAIPVFEPRPDEQLTPGPVHNLDDLMLEVLDEARRILQAPNDLPYSGSGSVTWTSRLVKGWYGMAYFYMTEPQGMGTIRVNSLLDSPDVTAETVRFLLWHEYLHLYLKQGHTTIFREWERKWPGLTEAERFLDNLNEKFGVQYW